MKNISFLIIVSFSLTYSCSPPKQTSDFRSIKKSIDTLAIASPLVTIMAKNKGNIVKDIELSESNSTLITKVTINLLDSRYNLKNIRFLQDSVLYQNILISIDSSSGSIEPNKIKAIIDEHEYRNQARYVLVIFYCAEYNSMFEPNHNVREGLANNAIIINAATKPRSRLDIIVLDMQKKELKYYDRIESSDIDPRIPANVESFTKKVLKSIYYK